MKVDIGVVAKTLHSALLIAILTCTTTQANLASAGPCTPESNTQVHHYMYAGRSYEQLSDEHFTAIAAFEGAQISYLWRDLEPCDDENDCGYDFSEIDNHLRLLSDQRKELFIHIKDTTSPKKAGVPKYMVNNPKYGGGIEYQYGSDGRPNGTVARRWDPAVQKRFHDLMKELGKRFDGKVAGIRLGETAIDIKTKGLNAPKGFTPDIYVEAIKNRMQTMKEAFPNSVVIQHANFMPGEHEDHSRLRTLYKYGIEIGVGLGESDLLPKKHSHYAYELMQEEGIKGRALIAVAAEDGNYLGKTGSDEKPNAPWPNIVPEMCNFAKDKLNAQYIFWQNQKPFFAHDVVPFVRAGNH
jgi:hypothetical protein